MERYDFIVKKGKGKNTKLDKEYSQLINSIIQNCDEENEARWEVYNLMISELFKLDDGIYFQEIKYRVTDEENANEVLLDILSRYNPDELNAFVSFLKKRIEEYAEEDFYKRFF
jgi:hypothetical protein